MVYCYIALLFTVFTECTLAVLWWLPGNVTGPDHCWAVPLLACCMQHAEPALIALIERGIGNRVYTTRRNVLVLF